MAVQHLSNGTTLPNHTPDTNTLGVNWTDQHGVNEVQNNAASANTTVSLDGLNYAVSVFDGYTTGGCWTLEVIAGSEDIVYSGIIARFDIVDGKTARKYNLSTEFGIQLDSYADFLSFVIVPRMFIYFAAFTNI